MSSFREKWRHAFAVDSDGPAEPTTEQLAGVDWIAHQVSKRHLTTPSLVAIEMSRPLNWLAAQGMHMMEPAIWAVAPRAFHENYKHFARFLEHRGALETIARRIEDAEAEHERAAEEGAGSGPPDAPRRGRDTTSVRPQAATERPRKPRRGGP